MKVKCMSRNRLQIGQVKSKMETATNNTRENQSERILNTSLSLLFDEEMTKKYTPIIVYLSLLILVGSVSNVLVSYIYGCKLKANTCHLLYAWLGIIDLGCCFLAIPSEIALIAVSDSTIFCKMARYFQFTYAVASLCLLMVIAMDRYFRVCRPLRPQMEVFHAKIGLAFSIGLAVLLAIPIPVMFGTKPVDVPEKGWKAMDCTLQDKYLNSALLTYGRLTNGTVIIGCTIFLAVIYIFMWREIRRCKLYDAQRLPGFHRALSESRPSTVDTDITDPTNALESRRLSNRRFTFLSIPERMSIFATTSQELTMKIRHSIHASKSTQVALMVTLMFVFSFFPQVIIMVIKTLTHFVDYQLTGATFFFYHICRYSVFINAVGNAFIYSGMSSEFWTACKQMLFCSSSTEIVPHSGLIINVVDYSSKERQS